MSIPSVGDLVYLPAGHRLVKYGDNRKTVTQYCELKVPCVCLVVGISPDPSVANIFYRGKIWQSRRKELMHYRETRNNEERVC